MAVPRPALLAILGFLLIAGTFFATHRSSSGSDSASAPAAKPATHKSVPAKPAAQPKKTAAGTPAAKKAEPVKKAVPQHKAVTTKPKAAVQPQPHAPAAKSPSQQVAASDGLPAAVARAFSQHKVVVLFFRGSGADDAATAASVRDLKAKSHGKVAVFSDKLSNLADYRRIVEGLDISQAPSTVVVSRDMKARLLEGFVDSGSLRQVVADVAR